MAQEDDAAACNPFRNHSDHVLVERAWIDRKAAAAMQVEIGRRLMQTMKALEKTNSRLAVVGIVLAVIGALLGAAQVWAAFSPPQRPSVQSTDGRRDPTGGPEQRRP